MSDVFEYAVHQIEEIEKEIEKLKNHQLHQIKKNNTNCKIRIQIPHIVQIRIEK